MEIRSYEGLQDLQAMLDLLSKGCKSNNGTHYVHRGDLQWWLYYTDTPAEIWQSNIRLWTEKDDLAGWILLSKEEQAFDVFIDPRLCRSSWEHEMLDWAVENMSEFESFETIWVAESDEARIQWLEANGFRLEQQKFIYFKKYDQWHCAR